jgi:hypothetical protein
MGTCVVIGGSVVACFYVDIAQSVPTYLPRTYSSLLCAACSMIQPCYITSPQWTVGMP